jgi:hypothetical protein
MSVFPAHSLATHPKALWGAVEPPPPVNLAPVPGPNPQPRLPPPSRPPSTSTSRAAPQTAPPRSAPAAEPNPSAPPMNCFCGKPSIERTVKKESANKGRLFRRCGQTEKPCDFFEWADEPPRDAGNGNGMKRAVGPPNPPSIPAKRSRTDDAVRAPFSPYPSSSHDPAPCLVVHSGCTKEILSV